MQINKKGLELIKLFEGFSAKMYKDPIGIPTIGYGEVIDTKEEKWLLTATITESQASNLLMNHLAYYENGVSKLVIKPLNENQFSALVSFAYNCGIQNLKISTLLKKVNINPNDPTIVSEFLKWDKSGGKVFNGLTKRRKAESTLYIDKI